MERKFLEELGLTKEATDKLMAQHGKDIEAHKAAADNAAKERDSYKAQLEDVANKLKAFDGVDVDALRGEVDALKKDMAENEADYKRRLAERDFQALLAAGIAEAKGKNAKAILALLDVEALKASQNQKEDTAEAIKALAETDAYLFEAADATQGNPVTPATVKTGGEHTDTNSASGDPFVAAARKGAGLST